MKNFIFFIVIFVTVIKLSSCFPEPLKIDLPVYEPKLVVASQFSEDSGVYITLTRSFSALTDNYKPEKINIDFINKVFSSNSLVIIEHSGVNDTLQNIAPGIYYNANIPVIDNEVYGMYIYDTLIDNSVTSQATVLPSVIFDTVFVNISENQNDTSAVVHYTFTDLSGYNYYMINYYRENKDSSNQSIYNINPNDPLFQELADTLGYFDFFRLLQLVSSIGTDVESTILINEEDIESNIYSGTVEFYNISMHDTLVISISNISESYYNYLEYKEKSGSLYSQLLGEPINLPSNIDTGYGLFTAHKQYFKKLHLSDY